MVFTLHSADPLFEEEGEMGGRGTPFLTAAAALGLPGHDELKVAISKVLTMERWGGSKQH